MSTKKRSFLDAMSAFFLVAVMITYFIIANAFLGASAGWWTYDQADIFSQGLFILLGVVNVIAALHFGAAHLNRRLNPPPPPPAKRSLPNRRPFETRAVFAQSQSLRKAKNDQVSHTRQDYTTSDLPF